VWVDGAFIRRDLNVSGSTKEPSTRDERLIFVVSDPFNLHALDRANE
jgi:hypothetical protein